MDNRQEKDVTVGQLSERARSVFHDIVNAYLETGSPIGSRTLSRQGSIHLSSASIRNVMQDLEEMGLLMAPHTSAGRIPTENGLRLFVDGMMKTAEPSPEDIAAFEAELGKGNEPVESMLARTTATLSGLAQCAAVVATTKNEARLKQVSFVALGNRQTLAVLVGLDGSIENRVMELGSDVGESALKEAENYINDRLSGLSLQAAVERLKREIRDGHSELDRLTARLIREGLADWSSDGRSPVLIVRGQAHLLNDTDLDRTRALLGELEEKAELVRILDNARDAEALKIFIGAENELFALSGSSVIAAPYRSSSGRVIGVVGVIGPTRLNYARIVPMVDFTANRLTRLLA